MPHWYQRHFGWIPRPVRMLIIGVIGGTLLLIGLIGIVMPIMPGFIFIPIALAILAVEFTWAGAWLHKIRTTAGNTHRRMKAGWNLHWPMRTAADARSGEPIDRERQENLGRDNARRWK